MDGADGHYRLSDADRAAAIARLRKHAAAGRLAGNELAHRTGLAQAARTRAELAELFADLPDERPLRRAWRHRGWRTHAVVFLVVTSATIALWLRVRDPDPLPRDYGTDYWWPLWLTLAWAVLVLLHLLRVAGLLRAAAATGVREPGRVVVTTRPAQVVDARPVALATGADAAEAAGSGLADRLTTREREVLALIGRGYANKEIARALFITERTARTHVSNILRKLDLSSRTQAALLAREEGVVD
jgi:DNA-binding CsgD family transcriptional regulator